VSLPRLAFLLPLGALLAFVLPVTGHGDLFITAFNSTLILTDHPNFYRALADEPTGVFSNGLSGGPYGPLFYYPMAAWLWLLDALHLINIHAWAGPNDPALHSLREIFLLKLPNLAVYLLVAYVLLRTWRGERGEAAAGLWLANPAVLLFSLLMGQNDCWTALSVVAGLFLALRSIDEEAPARRRSLAVLSMLVLAAGGAAKLSPVLLVPPFAWLTGRDPRERALFMAAGALAFLAFVGPFFGTAYFWDHGLFGRQPGQTPNMPQEWVAVLYAAYLAIVVAISTRDADRSRGLLFSLVALHVLIYLLPDWNPQRAVLFLAVLTAAVPARRAFVVPYLLVTAVSLVLALEHRNGIATELFAPLSSRVFLVPPLAPSGQIEPLLSTLYVLSAIAWGAALVSLWWTRSVALRWLRWSPAVGVALLAGLLVYVGAAFSRLPDGIDVVSYTTPASSLAVQPGQTLTVAFVSGGDDLRSVSVRLEDATTASVRVVSDTGDALYANDSQPLVAGDNRIDVGRVALARGRWFRVELTPAASTRVAMSEVPPALVVAVAELNGVPLRGRVPAYTVHYQPAWGAFLSDVRGQLADGWVVLTVSGALVLVAMGAALMSFRRGDITSPLVQ